MKVPPAPLVRYPWATPSVGTKGFLNTTPRACSVLLSHLDLELLVPALHFSFPPRTSPSCTALVCSFLQRLLFYLFCWLHLLDFLPALQTWMYPQGEVPLVSPLHVHQLSIQTSGRTCLQRLPKLLLWLASPHDCPHRSKPNVISSGLLPLLPSWFCPGDHQPSSLTGLDVPAFVLLSYPICVSQCHHSYNYSNHSTMVRDISESLGRVLRWKGIKSAKAL